MYNMKQRRWVCCACMCIPRCVCSIMHSLCLLWTYIASLAGVDDLLKYLEVLNEARRELRALLERGDEAAQGRLRYAPGMISLKQY